jgi:hypothetical protein
MMMHINKLFLLLLAVSAYAHSMNNKQTTQARRPLVWTATLGVPIAKNSSVEEMHSHLKEILGNRFTNAFFVGNTYFCALSGSREEIRNILQKEPWFKEETLEESNWLETTREDTDDNN